MMVSVENLGVEFGVKPLFSGASFVVNGRDRIALVGKNGAGKSTLLKIISGQQHPTTGQITMPQGTTVGYLPQVMKLSDETTVRQEAQKAFADVAALKQHVDELERQMGERTDYESDDYMELVERYTLEHERYLMMGAESQEAQLERTLMGLGFERTDFDRPTCEFSGGWRMRIELAKILLQRPDVLLLDEPTNHLDIESIRWLEQFLIASASAVMLVSHDRAFINNVCNRTMEISCGQIIDYRVKYDEYVVLRKERREQQLRAYENQQKEMQDMRAFIERFRYQATKAVQVQQKIRQLEKIVPIEVDEVDNSALRLKFPPCLRSGDYPVICDEVRKEYDHLVFDHVNLTIKRGEKVAFVGRNGEGKSTLVKCIMNEIPFDGHLKIGHNVQIGYFAQNQAQLLDESLTVFETIDRVARGEIRLKIRDILGAFMFGGEASDKKVKVLSGGERSRLAMIKLLLEPVNFLILDEPTNHLDMQSKDVLKEAIQAFDGTVIVVSHDRQFLDGLVSEVYAFGGGKVREHLGGIYDWIREGRSGFSTSSTPSNHSPSPLSETGHLNNKNNKVSLSNRTRTEEEGRGENAATSWAEQKALARQRKKIEKAVTEAEGEIAEIEAAISILEAKMATPDGASDMSLYDKHARFKAQLSQAEERWMSAQEELETLKD